MTTRAAPSETITITTTRQELDRLVIFSRAEWNDWMRQRQMVQQQVAAMRQARQQRRQEIALQVAAARARLMAAQSKKRRARRQDVPDTLLLSPEEAARRLSLGRTTLYALMKSGQVSSVKIGKRRLVPARAIERYVLELEGLYEAQQG